MKQPGVVAIGEMRVSTGAGERLMTYGLGSCVVVTLYDPVARVGGMLHALLPAPLYAPKAEESPTRFVDPGLTHLLAAVEEWGAVRRRLVACLCGGAQMFAVPGRSDSLAIGPRNVKQAEELLQTLRLPLVGRATGGQVGRTVRLYLATGCVTVRTLNEAEHSLTPPPFTLPTFKQERAPMKVMVVDDTEFIRHRLSKILSNLGCEVIEVEDGDQAIRAYPFWQPDVVFMDITMPHKDGLTTLSEIRLLDPRACVIMLTALDQHRTVALAFERGAHDYLVKPFDEDQVRQALEAIAA